MRGPILNLPNSYRNVKGILRLSFPIIPECYPAGGISGVSGIGAEGSGPGGIPPTGI